MFFIPAGKLPQILVTQLLCILIEYYGSWKLSANLALCLVFEA